MKSLGLFHSHADPSAALMINGEVVAFIEEERLLRNKHAFGAFPIRSVEWLLKQSGLSLEDLDVITQAWNCEKYDNGTVARHYEDLNAKYPTSDEDLAYQRRHLSSFQSKNQIAHIQRNLSRQFGDVKLPPIEFVDHHLAHACTAFFTSGFEDSLVLTLDGSGEELTTTWWIGRAGKLELLREIKVPHSLGWFYSAFTEFLGFDAYDGEYKVMGLAAYGKHDSELKAKVDQILWFDGEGGFEENPMLISRGPRTRSYYYPDSLEAHMGRPRRAFREDITDWHKDLGHAVQTRIEEVVHQMVDYWVRKTGIKRLCISGGVGLNVKMNGNLFASKLLEDLHVYPLCSDAGQAIGATMAHAYNCGKLKNRKLESIYLGPEYSDNEIRETLTACGLAFTVESDIATAAARLISNGKVIGWFQGRMEGGPRALGSRSILADPRTVASRDRVNSVIKYRELWRPFCPSMTEEGAKRYFTDYTHAPFMILTFRTNERAAKEVPAIVHIDQTARPQIVTEDQNPRYHRLLTAFQKESGVPVLLNTSFNVKGEPIVCTPHDAIRTFFATGMDALAIGNCLIRKAGIE